MHTLFEPRLVNDVFGDPGLYVDFRDERRALLFDLGDISSLPPRKLMRLSHVFVTHTHMDHFAGFDHLLRVVLGRMPRLTLFGRPDLAAQVEHKLRAYAWNVVHRYEVELVIDVCEIGTDGRALRERFSSRTQFAREPGETPIDVRWRGRHGDHAVTRTASELRDVILDVVPGRRVGYVTDLRYTEPNVRKLTQLLDGVDVLFIECVFLEEDLDHATRKNHLTARQAGQIARTVGAKAVVPFHFSPRYEGRSQELIAQMRAAAGERSDARLQNS